MSSVNTEEASLSGLTRPIRPQILFHTFWTLKERGISLKDDPLWGAFEPRGLFDGIFDLSLFQCQNLISRAITLSGDVDLGLSVGQRQTIGSWGPVASAMLASQNLAQALQLGVKYHRVAGSALEFYIDDLDAESFGVCIRPRNASLLNLRFHTQESLVALPSIGNYICPGMNAIKAIETPFIPQDMTRFPNLASLLIPSGSSLETVVIVDKVALLKPIPTADAYGLRETLKLLDQEAECISEKTTLLTTIETMVMRDLPQQPSIANVANRLGMSERSLRRKLSRIGTSYRDLLGRIRCNLAQDMMASGTKSRDQIAYELGFEDARSLRRLLERERGRLAS